MLTTTKHRWVRLIPAWLAILFCFGCAAGTRSFVQESVDFSRIQRCAILPFENLTSDGFADDRIRSIFLMELLRRNSIVPVELEETEAAMQELQILVGTAPTPEQIMALGKALEVQAVFFGTVEEYGQSSRTRQGTCFVTAAFSMSETEGGGLVWRSQAHVDGSSFWRHLFGGDPPGLYDVSREAVQKSLGTLF